MSSHFHQEFPSLQAAGEVKDGQEEEPYGPGPSLRPQSMDTTTRGGSCLQFSLVYTIFKISTQKKNYTCGNILGCFLVCLVFWFGLVFLYNLNTTVALQ